MSGQEYHTPCIHGNSMCVVIKLKCCESLNIQMSILFIFVAGKGNKYKTSSPARRELVSTVRSGSVRISANFVSLIRLYVLYVLQPVTFKIS